MMKKKFVSLLLLSMLSISGFAASCGKTDHHSDPEFCTHFETIAKCNCTVKMRNNPQCQNMNFIISSISTPPMTIDLACKMQHDTSPQDCKNNWNCYIQGCRGSDKSCLAAQ